MANFIASTIATVCVVISLPVTLPLGVCCWLHSWAVRQIAPLWRKR